MRRLFSYNILHRWTICLMSFMFINTSVHAQNLVVNPSFENVNLGNLNCSWYTTVAQFNGAINNWTLPTGGSTDIFHTSLATTCYCSPFSTNGSSPGTQAPRTGDSFVNIVTYGNGGCTPWREYIQGELTSPLVVGSTYEVEMWVSLADNMSVGTDNIGVKFDTNPYFQASNCPYYTTPELNYTGPIILDKQNWVQILFCYTPTVAGQDNFIIGNFYNDGATNTAAATGSTTGNTIRYFVDDVRIELVPTGSGDPGTNGNISLCATDPPVDLFTLLGGTPTTNGTWSGPSALAGGYLGSFDPATNAAGTYTYSVGGSGPCAAAGGGSADVVVTVANNFDATITPAGPYCETDPTVTLVGADPGGSWTGTGITNATTGDFDPATAGIGTHTITYTITGSCGDQQTTTIDVVQNMDATITPAGPFCPGDPAQNLIGADPGGNWTGTGITDAVNGTFDPATAGVGTHTITYTIAGNCGDQQTITITVSSQLDATITPVNPFCVSNASAILTAVDAGGIWSGTGITDAVNGIFDPAVAGIGTHTITYTISGGCGDQQTTQIQVIPNDDATITPAGPFCITDPTATLIGADPGGTWAGTGITDMVNGIFDPATAGAGTHTITYTISGACGDQQTTTITVNNQLDASITGVGPYCVTDPSVTLLAVDGGGLWAGTGIIDVNTGSFDPATAGVGTHVITYTIAGNCGDQQTTSIAILPNADATITPVGPFCAGSPSLNLVGATAGGTWSGTGILDAVNGTFDPASAGIGTHIITYSIAGQCGDQQTTAIVIDQLMDATVIPTGPFCAGAASSNLFAINAGGTWSGTGITDPANGVFDPATAGPGTHAITYTITGACGNTGTTDIVVNPMPVIDFTGDNLSGCVPVTVNFTDNTLPAGTTCLWDFGDGNASTSCGTATHTYTTDGCFDVTLTIITADGCMSTQTVTNMVCAYPIPEANFTFGPQPTTVFNPTIHFNNTSAGATTYEWDFAGLGTSTAANPTFTFPSSAPGTYEVCLIAISANGCSDTTCQYVIIDDEFIIYVPNAFTVDNDGINDIFTPVISGVNPLDYTFQVFNRWGELIFETNSTTTGWDGTYKGTAAKQDVYVWKIQARAAATNERKEYVGHVTLLK
jgi:gliding motility-associated-like protein